VPIVVNKRFGFGIPASYLVSKMDACVQEIFYRYVHNNFRFKALPERAKGEIIFFLGLG